MVPDADGADGWMVGWLDGCWMVLEVILLVTIGYQSNTIWICLVMITHDNAIAMIT